MSYYQIDIEDIIKNLSVSDIQVLIYLEEQKTDLFNGINLKDMLEDVRILEFGLKYTKLYTILDKLKLIDAVGSKTNCKFNDYYIKKNGKQILEYLDNN